MEYMHYNQQQKLKIMRVWEEKKNSFRNSYTIPSCTQGNDSIFTLDFPSAKCWHHVYYLQSNCVL